jgi:two-component sensor histidine kinase
LPSEVLDVLPGAVYVCDSEGRIVRCNQRAVELWGRAPKLGSMDDRFCGSLRLYRMDGSPLPHDQCPVAEVLRHGRPMRDQEVMIERPDGSRITALANIVALRDGSGTITGAVNCFLDITERKEAEEKTRLYAREVNHRANNLLTLLNAMIRQTRAESVPDLVTMMEGRIHALARVQTRLARNHWTSTDLLTLVKEELAPFMERDGERIRLTGPPVPLAAHDAQALAIVIHELATNAAKYGALSEPGGRVAIDWTLAADQQLALSWLETGGPAVSPPDRQGFGTRAIPLLADQLDGKVDVEWRREGLACVLTFPAPDVASRKPREAAIPPA